MITTVSSPRKALLAAAAGADHVVNYREQDVVHEVRKVAPHGVDTIVEVSPSANAAIDAEVLARHGSVAMYANDGGDDVTLPVRRLMAPNARWQFVLVYTMPGGAKERAVEDVSGAVYAGAVRVGRGGRPAAAPLPPRAARRRPSGRAGRRGRQGADRRQGLSEPVPGSLPSELSGIVEPPAR